MLRGVHALIAALSVVSSARAEIPSAAITDTTRWLRSLGVDAGMDYPFIQAEAGEHGVLSREAYVQYGYDENMQWIVALSAPTTVRPEPGLAYLCRIEVRFGFNHGAAIIEKRLMKPVKCERTRSDIVSEDELTGIKAPSVTEQIRGIAEKLIADVFVVAHARAPPQR